MTVTRRGLREDETSESLTGQREAAKKRLHRNVIAIALANKLARIAWSVLAPSAKFRGKTGLGVSRLVYMRK